MSAYVLLNLLNKLDNEIKCKALPSILLLFHNQVFCVVLVLLSWVKVKNFQNPEL